MDERSDSLTGKGFKGTGEGYLSQRRRRGQIKPRVGRSADPQKRMGRNARDMGLSLLGEEKFDFVEKGRSIKGREVRGSEYALVRSEKLE